MPAALPPSDPAFGSKRSVWIGAAVIIVITCIAYIPAVSHGGFIWDDDSYVTENAFLRQGIDGLVAMWTPKRTPQYYPVVFTTFWIEYQAWGVDPTGYHAVNVLLHALNAALVFLLARQLRLPWPWLIGAIWALHPVNVESVAWITERKNTLSGFFYLIAALVYLRFDDDIDREPAQAAHSDVRRWVLCVTATACFVLALLSKSVTCSLPAALILMMLWQRKRLTASRLLPLVPLFVLGLLLALNTANIEREHVGATGEGFDFSIADRFLIASKALLFYPYTIIKPWPVMFIYPRWTIDDAHVAQYWSVAAVIMVAVIAIVLYARGRRGFGLALAFFAGTIFPALGFVNVYPMIFSFVADHFQYLASLGIIALLVGMLSMFFKTQQRMVLIAAVVLPALGAITWVQCGAYRSVETIFRDTIAKNDGAFMAYNNLASDLIRQSREADEAGQIDLAKALREEAMKHLRAAIALKPRYPQALGNIAAILSMEGRSAEALPYAQQSLAIIIDSDNVRQALSREPRPQHPPIAEAFADVARLQALLKQSDAARSNYQEALRWNQRDLSLLSEYATFLLGVNDRDAAADVLDRMLALAPDDMDLLGSAAEVARERSRFGDAKRLYQRAVAASKPGSPSSIRWQVRLALMLADCPDASVRDPAGALAMMQTLVDRTQHRDPALLDVLANVLAATGDVDRAIVVAEEAAQRADQMRLPELAKDIRARAEAYRAKPQKPIGPTRQ